MSDGTELQLKGVGIDSAKHVSKKAEHRTGTSASVGEAFSLWSEVVPHWKGYDSPHPAHLITASPHMLLQGRLHGELAAWKATVKLLEADTGSSHAQPNSNYG